VHFCKERLFSLPARRQGTELYLQKTHHNKTKNTTLQLRIIREQAEPHASGGLQTKPNQDSIGRSSHDEQIPS